MSGPGPLLLTIFALSIVCGSGCVDRAQEPTGAEQVPTEPAPAPRFRWLDEPQQTIVADLLQTRDADGETLLEARQEAFLDAYAAAFDEFRALEELTDWEPVLKLWEFDRAARQASIAAHTVLRAARIPPYTSHASKHPPAPGAKQDAYRLTSIEEVAPGVARILKDCVMPDATTYWEGMATAVNYLVTVDQPVEMDPELPLTFMGTAEPITRTVFIAPKDAITGREWPDWLQAAVIVHEAEHIRWHCEYAGDDPRRLLPLPDERNAYLRMHEFLTRLPPAEKEGLSPRVEADKLRGLLEQANQYLGYAADDFTRRDDILVGREFLELNPSAGYQAPQLPPA